jgi:hypothetical protein
MLLAMMSISRRSVIWRDRATYIVLSMAGLLCCFGDAICVHPGSARFGPAKNANKISKQDG